MLTLFFERMDEEVVWYKYFINNFTFSMPLSSRIAKGYHLNQLILETGYF